MSNRVRELLESMRASFEAGRLGQGYVVVGEPRGEGMAFAEGLLQIVFSEELSAGKLTVGSHPDILWVEPKKKSRRILVEQVREVQRRTYRTSFTGGWKACIMVGADRLGDEASNALLKTLEEPPPRSIFLLLTDSPQALLDTITSRCQKIVLSGEGDSLPDDIRARLIAMLKQSAPANSIAGLALSSEVLALFAEVKQSVAEEQEEYADSERREEDSETIQARIESRYKEVRAAIMRFLLLWHRDILLCAAGAGTEQLQYAEHADFFVKHAGDLTYRDAQRNLGLIERMNSQLERNLPEGAVFELGFAGISAARQ